MEKLRRLLFCEWIEDKLNSLSAKYDESLDTMFKPFQLLENMLVKWNKGINKSPRSKEEESPIKNVGLLENLFETLVLNQWVPSKTCKKILEELEICLTK